MTIRCVMWDCFNVLIPFDTPKFFEFLRRYRGNDLPPEKIFSGSGLDLVKSYDLGQISSDVFYDGVKELYRLDGVSSEVFFTWIGHIVKPDREMLAIKNELARKGVATVMVSNMNPFHYEFLKKNFPEFVEGFDYMMVSCEEGIAKPNPEAWIRPLDFLGLRAEECIFIDDSWSNIEAASRLGIKGWYYNSTDRNWCPTGKLEEERRKFKNFLDILWNEGILKPR